MSHLRQSTLGVSAVLRGLGVKGGDLPQVDVERYQPVLVMGDFSRTLTAEPLEARGVSAGLIGAVSGQRGTIELHANSPGGIILEQVMLSAPATGSASGTFQAGVATSTLSLGVSSDILDVGGAATRSHVDQGTQAAALSVGASFPTMGEVSGGANMVDLGPLRWYVPSGGFFQAQVNTTQQLFGFILGWREIPTPIGLP